MGSQASFSVLSLHSFIHRKSKAEYSAYWVVDLTRSGDM